MDAGEPYRLRRALLGGLLWCAIVALAESVDEPIAQLSLHEQISFILMIASNLIAPALIWSLGAELPASRRRPVLAFLVLLPTTIVASELTRWIIVPLFRHSSDMARNLFQTPEADIDCHYLWINLFYGGLLVVASHYTRRNLELRRRLAALRLVLGVSEMRLREARLQTLHEQLRPATLVQALQRLQQRYTRDPASGDRLFDALVAFLRVAMPSVRENPRSAPTGKSLIKGYADLRNAIDPTVPRWNILDDAPLAQGSGSSVSAPPRLLAVLDHVDHAIPEGRTIDVIASGSATEYAVRIRATVELKASELQQLIEALGELDARIAKRPGPGTSLKITLRAPPTPDHTKPAKTPIQHHYEGGKHVADLAQNHA